MLRNYFKTAWRNILRNKTTSFINLFGLSVGMTAAVMILMWVQNEMSFDNYHPNVKQIYRLTCHINTANWVIEVSPLLLSDAIQKEIPEIKSTAKLRPIRGAAILNIKGELFSEKNCTYYDKGWFKMFHYDYVEGNPNTAIQNPFSIIMTETKAKKYFGNHAAVGQIIRIDTINYAVQAVIKDNPQNSSFQYDIFIPLDAFLAGPVQRGNDQDWGNMNYITFVQINENANSTTIGKKITAILQKNKKRNDEYMTLFNLQDMHFETDLTSSKSGQGNKNTVYFFSLLAFVLLFTACINYVNLTTAKASVRAKEISIRKIIGAKRMHLFGQFIAESLLISFLALIITLILIWFCLPLYNLLTDKHFVFSLSSLSMWKIMLGTLLLVTLLNGVYPAMMLSSFKPLNVFRGLNLLSVKDTTLRKILVVFQFTISVMLIIGATIIYKQMHFMQTTDPGYQRSQIIYFQFPKSYLKYPPEETSTIFKESLLHELSVQNNIIGVTSANQPIVNMQSFNSGSADWDGRDTSFRPTIAQMSVEYNFQKVFGIILKEGRWFLQGGKTDKKNFILNETAIAQLNIHKPIIGQRFVFHGDTGKVIGVAKDFHYISMHEKIGPLVFNTSSSRMAYVFIKSAPGSATQALSNAEKVFKKFAPNEPFDYTFLDDTFDNLYKTDRKTSILILVFSIIAIIISAMGLFGLIAFTAERKTKEIGVRKVLGASVGNITTLLSKEFIILVFIAIMIASPIAWWVMNKWLQNFAYRININWSVFVFAGITVLIIALVTISFQAVKAAVANPVKSLRTE
jgi:ABC-type antimicrobial peptide transport system permease subunit